MEPHTPKLNELLTRAISTMNKLTEEQEALEALAKDGNCNITGRARAGSGKTFMLKLLAALWPNKRILYVTFSKLLADEAAEAGLPSNVDIKTSHALAYGSCKKYYSPTGKLNINDYFRDQALFEFLDCPMFQDKDTPEEDALVREDKRIFLSLISFCKYNMAESIEEIEEVMTYYGISAEPWMIELLDKAKKFSLKPSGTINFTEMVHTPVLLDLPMPKYDIILADEVQDSNMMIMKLYEKCLAPGGKIICVGDDWQAIYGFAGSRNESLQIFTDRFQCETMPLSVNFRCGINHLKLAQELVPDIKAHDHAIDGEVIYSHEPKLVGLKSGDLVLCRTNAPLVGPCLALIKEGVKAIIKGKDLAGPIISILKKVNKLPKSKALDRIVENEEADMRIADKRKYKKASIDAITERYAIAKMFLMESDGVEEAIKRIYGIFSDKNEGIVFSSIHKSKGLEADNVTILQANKMRMSRSDMLPWQHEQEAHLEYVALTRPKKKLTLMYEDTKEEKEADEE
jgi:DNA helicase-2/ATP-dependent DNA helicase PcrA